MAHQTAGCRHLTARYAALNAIDVVLPCFNGARYVRAAIESALAQSLPPARIIVIDDGSTDGSDAVIRSYGAPVEYFRQENAGPASARNNGVQRTQAQYVAFLDADDLWTEDSLQMRLLHLAERPDVDGVFASLSAFLSPEVASQLAGSRHFDPQPAVARFPGTFLVRRKSFARAGGFDESLRIGEMLEWVARAEAAGLRFDTLNHLALRRRIHQSNSMQRDGHSSADYVKAIRGVLARKRAAGLLDP